MGLDWFDVGRYCNFFAFRKAAPSRFDCYVLFRLFGGLINYMSGESGEVMLCSIKRGSTTSQNYSSLGRRHRYVVTNLRLGQYNEETRPTRISMLALQTSVVSAMCTVSSIECLCVVQRSKDL